MKSSSSSDRDDVTIDEKKKKRMLSNRESARRSRMKREQHIKDLNDQVAYFTKKNMEMVGESKKIAEKYEDVKSKNNILQMRGDELKKRLELLEGMLASWDASCSYLCDDDALESNDKFCNLMDTLSNPLAGSSCHVDGIYQF